MATKYYKFSKKMFEFKVRDFLIKNKLGLLKEISAELAEAEGTNIWEYVYSVSTKNKAVDILIYSSVDKKTDMCREKDSDAVRVVIRWKTKNGIVYKKLKKHLRIKTVFENLNGTIKEFNPFSLNYKEFKMVIPTEEAEVIEYKQVYVKKPENANGIIDLLELA